MTFIEGPDTDTDWDADWASDVPAYTVTCQFAHHNDCPGRTIDHDSVAALCGCDCHARA